MSNSSVKFSFLKIILPFSLALILLTGAAFLFSYMRQVKASEIVFAMERGLDDIYQMQIAESKMSAEAYHYAATGQPHNLRAFHEQKEYVFSLLQNLEKSQVNDLFDPVMNQAINGMNGWIRKLVSLLPRPFFGDSTRLYEYLKSPAYAQTRQLVFNKLAELERNVITEREHRAGELKSLTRFNTIGFMILMLVATTMLVIAYRVNAARIRQLYQFQLQLKDREFEVAFQHAPIGKMIVDNNGICVRVNKSLCEMLDYDEATLTKKKFAELSPPGEYEEDLKVIALLIQGNIKTHEREKQLITSRGDILHVWQSMSFVNQDDGSPHRLIIQLKDITAEREGWRKLQESNAELEQFAYTASHDLKEPLRMINGFMKLLEKNYGDRLDENGKKYIHFASDGARRMNILLEDLLEYSRATRTSEEPEGIDMNEMMADIVEVYRPVLEQKKATIHYQRLPLVFVSRVALRTVLQNLISNALKYQKDNTLPEVTISATELTNAWQVAVTDNGIGIRPEFFEKIFVIFKRLHGKAEYEGSGIGLATCKRLVEHWGGRIDLTSEEGMGSTFCFTIPKKKPC